MGDLYSRLKAIKAKRERSGAPGRNDNAPGRDENAPPRNNTPEEAGVSGGDVDATSRGVAAGTPRGDPRDASGGDAAGGSRAARLDSSWRQLPGGGVYHRKQRHPLRLDRIVDRFDSDGRWRSLSPLTGFDAKRTPVLLDIETSGLSSGAGSVAFLIGIGTPVGEAIEVQQFFLSDLGAESVQLQSVTAALAEITAPLYVTYNGGSFDLPVLRTRYIMNRMRFPEHAHFDLLHIVRRLYRERIGSCSLGNVESHVLGYPRVNDTPGSEAPALYGAFLRSGDVSPVEAVFTHHYRDIAHLAEVALTVNDVLVGADGVVHEDDRAAPDRIGLARILLERGGAAAVGRARRLLEAEYAESQARAARIRALGDTFRRGGRARFPSSASPVAASPGAASSVAAPRGSAAPTRRWLRTRELLADLYRRNGELQRYEEIAEELYRVVGRRVDVERYAKVLEHDRRRYGDAVEIISGWAASYGWDERLRRRYERVLSRAAKRKATRTDRSTGQR